jgi:[protein-PII] uridylyltransferase
LLHDIAGTLTGVGLDIRSAHIATYAGQALDTFYLTTDGGRVLDPAEAALAVAAIIDACG